MNPTYIIGIEIDQNTFNITLDRFRQVVRTVDWKKGDLSVVILRVDIVNVEKRVIIIVFVKFLVI